MVSGGQPAPSWPVPVFYLQYAYSAEMHDQVLESYQHDFNARVAQQTLESANTDMGLKTAVLWIGLGASIASIVVSALFSAWVNGYRRAGKRTEST
jgi:hypothetical protein